ncbi:Melanoma-derived growth regulatory protein [Nibea albiflora]|uniref:Melanoma-derived growth regulatory protein n=1 Tax=Nibea albiflora TaxID=240163 RepID=A0ACB7F252_NIBAL|nr:Melanoma-derived growth regulatory protein [Nibea albiflora]
MPKLSDKKLCADSECSYPILIARALQDYYPGDCRFIPIRQGQLIYVYAMLKDRGNLFWAGTVQDTYYGQQEARIGHFPSSVVEETHPLMPASTEVKTTVGEHTHIHTSVYYVVLSPNSISLLVSRNGTSTATDTETTHCLSTALQRNFFSYHMTLI